MNLLGICICVQWLFSRNIRLVIDVELHLECIVIVLRLFGDKFNYSKCW